MEKFTSFWKKMLHKIRLYDFTWSIPFSFLAFVLHGIFQEVFFGHPLYSTEWYNRAVLAVSILLLFHGVAFLGINYNFRGIFRYFYTSEEVKQDFKELPKWLKILFFPFLYFFYILILTLIFVLIKNNIQIPLN